MALCLSLPALAYQEGAILYHQTLSRNCNLNNDELTIIDFAEAVRLFAAKSYRKSTLHRTQSALSLLK
ncbi:hypothetical protein O9993_16035 [Vibrio lentus]|nr:hypothetical protein [Vibrio lentus]